MILPAMQRVHDKVNFTLSFIGTWVAPELIANPRKRRFELTRPCSRPTSDDGVDCRHGPQECMLHHLTKAPQSEISNTNAFHCQAWET